MKYVPNFCSNIAHSEYDWTGEIVQKEHVRARQEKLKTITSTPNEYFTIEYLMSVEIVEPAVAEILTLRRHLAMNQSERMPNKAQGGQKQQKDAHAEQQV